MKKIFILFALCFCVIAASAQHKKDRRFDPALFQAHLEQFIVREAALLPKEAEAFFPVFREMQEKQRVIFEEQRRLRNIKPVDESGCRESILKNDDLDLQIKELQRQYHQKFLRVLPASKVFDVLKAEDKFHRQAFKRAAEKGRQGGMQSEKKK